MKKNFSIVLFTFLAFAANAQTFKDSFDSNVMGWTEISSKEGEAVIKEGVMHLEGKNSGSGLSEALWGVPSKPASQIITSCYAPFDVKKNFELSCKATVKKINENNMVGILFDYYDDYNFRAFVIDDEVAYYFSYTEGDLTGFKSNLLKLKDKKKADIEFRIKSTYNKIEFIVNNMQALEIRYAELISSGIGLYVRGAQVADFDNFEVIQ